MSTAIAAPSAAPDAVPEHVRVGQRVAQQALERGAGDRQRRRRRPSPSGPAAGAGPLTIVSAAADQVPSTSSPNSRWARIADRVAGRDRRPCRARRRASSATTSATMPARGEQDRAADGARPIQATVGRLAASGRRRHVMVIGCGSRRCAADAAATAGRESPRPDGSPARARAGPRRGAGRGG